MVSGGEFCDPAMLELFQSELDTHLPVLGEGLLALEKEADQPKQLEAMMRAAHSIKGAARIVGVEPAVRVAHVLEDCFVAAQKGQVRLTPDHVDVLLRGVDFLAQVARGTGPEAQLQTLDSVVASIRGVLTGDTTSAAARPAGSRATAAPAAAEKKLERAALDALTDGSDESTPAYVVDLYQVSDLAPAALAQYALLARRTLPDGSPPRREITRATPAIRRLFRLTRLDAAWSFIEPED